MFIFCSFPACRLHPLQAFSCLLSGYKEMAYHHLSIQNCLQLGHGSPCICGTCCADFPYIANQLILNGLLLQRSTIFEIPQRQVSPSSISYLINNNYFFKYQPVHLFSVYLNLVLQNFVSSRYNHSSAIRNWLTCYCETEKFCFFLNSRHFITLVLCSSNVLEKTWPPAPSATK